MLLTLLRLARVSNLPTAWTNVLAAWLICGGGLWPVSGKLGFLLLGAACFYSAGMILNDAADARWDRQHKPERPIPSGQLSANMATIWGIGLLVFGLGLYLRAGADLVWTLSLVAAIVGYDLYHKPWSGAVVVMGVCRTLLYLATGSALIPEVLAAKALVQPAVALGLYIVGLTLTARRESSGLSSLQRAGVTALLWAPVLPLCIKLSAEQGLSLEIKVACYALVLIFLSFVHYVSQRIRQGGPSVGASVGWMLAGIAAVDALAVAALDYRLALAFLLMVPILRSWQRWVAAT
jgi:hypothetical protein